MPSLRSLWPAGALHVRRPDATVVFAVLVALSTGVPMLVLYLAGRIDLVAFAAFGAMTALYGRNQPYAVRGRLVAAAGLVQVAAVTTGAVTAAWSDTYVVLVPVVAVFAGVVRLLGDAVRMGPPGAVMPVFAVAICGELPLQGGDVLPAALVALLAAAWSWLVAMSGRLVRPHGPERVAVARALEAVAARLRAVGAPREPEARHLAAVQIQRAWLAVGSGRRPSPRTSRLEALCVHAESAMRLARQASAGTGSTNGSTGGETGRAAGGEAGGEVGAALAADLEERARLLRRFGPMPQVPGSSTDEADELSGLEVERALLLHPSSGTTLLRRSGEPWGVELRRFSLRAPYVPLAVRVGVGAAVAGTIAHLLGLTHTAWAAVSAVAVLQSANRTSTLQRSVQRALGTGGGLLLGTVALATSPGVGATMLMVFVLSGLAELVVMLNYAFALLFATPMALLLAHLGDPNTEQLLLHRLLDTAIGIVVGVLVVALVPNRRLAVTLRGAISAAEAAVARAASTPADAGTSVRLGVARDLAAAMFALRDAQDTAAGESWPDDLDTEDVLRLERAGHQELARLTR